MRFVSWSCHVNMCAWPTPCRIKCHEKGQYLLSLISESETHILYRFIKQSETFQVFISWNFDDYGFQIMKTQNSVSQKIRILHKINKKKDILNRNVRLLKSMFISMHSILGRASFCITASIRRGMEVINLWHCSGLMEAQVVLIAAFRSSTLLGLVSLIFLLTILHRFSLGFRSGEFADQSSTVTPWPLNQLLVPLAVWAGANPTGKWNQHLHKACQQKEAWSALKCPGRWLRWLWTSENTVDQHQQMTWQPKSTLTVETSHWTSSNMDSVSLHSSFRLWDLDFQIKCKIYFHLKRGLWTTEQQKQSSYFSP